MTSMRALALPVGVLAIAGLALTACGGSGGSSSSSSPAAPASTSAAPAPSSSEPPSPNPMPEGDCSEKALASAADHATSGGFGGVEEFACDGGYAYVGGKMNDQYDYLLFQVKDGSWMPVESQEVCQSGVLPDKISSVVCS